MDVIARTHLNKQLIMVYSEIHTVYEKMIQNAETVLIINIPSVEFLQIYTSYVVFSVFSIEDAYLVSIQRWVSIAFLKDIHFQSAWYWNT